VLGNTKEFANYKINRKIRETREGTYYSVSSDQESALILQLFQMPSAEPAHVKNFAKELSRLKKIDNASLPAIVDGGCLEKDQELKTICYLVSKPAQGTPLPETIQGRIAPALALDYTRQIALALKALHNAGMAHLRLQPDHVYLDDNNCIVIDNFYRAKIFGYDLYIGTNTHYLSPEQANGEIGSYQSDIYSLGILLYRMLTGVEPFQDGSPFRIAMLHIHSNCPPLPGNLSSIQPLMDKLLAKKAGNRLKSISELLTEIEKLSIPEGSTEATRIAEYPENEEVEKSEILEDFSEIAEDTRPDSDAVADRIRSGIAQAQAKAAEQVEESSIDTVDNIFTESDLDLKPDEVQAVTSVAKETRNPFITFLVNSQYRILWIALGAVITAALFWSRGEQLPPIQSETPVEKAAILQNDPATEFAVQLQQVTEYPPEARLEALQKLVNTYPNRPEAYNNLAVYQLASGDLEDARKILQQAIATHPSYKTVYDNLNSIYAAMAQSAYNKALDIGSGQTLPELALTLIPGDYQTPETKFEIAAKPAEQEVEAQNTKTEKPQATGQVSPQLATSEAPQQAPATEILQQTTNDKTPQEITAEKTVVVAAKQEKAEVPAVIEPVPSEQSQDKNDSAIREAIAEVGFEASIKRWAESWSRQDINSYLNFYVNNYSPAGMTHDQWVLKRQQSLKRPAWIKIKLRDIKLISHQGNQVVIEFIQEYTSDRFSDKVIKRVTMNFDNQAYRIVQEVTLGTL